MPRLRLYARGVVAGRRAAAPRRRLAHRQDQSRPVRHRPRRDALAQRREPQPVRSGLHPRRLELGIGSCGQRRPRELRPRHRYRRLRPCPGRLQQHRRAQADPWPHPDERRRARLPLARLRLDLCAYRRGCDGGARGGRGRPAARPLLSPRSRRLRRCRAARTGAVPLRRSPPGSATFLRQRSGGPALRRGDRTAGKPRRRQGRDRLCALRGRSRATLRRLRQRTHGRPRQLSRRTSRRTAPGDTADPRIRPWLFRR